MTRLEGTDARDLIFELVTRYEEDSDPFRFIAAGYCLWPIYRFRITLRLLAFASGDNFVDPSQETRPTVSAAVLELAKALPFELKGLWRASRGNTRVLGKSGPGWRRNAIGGRHMDMYFDLLEPALEGFTLSEACSSRQKGNPYPSIFDEFAYPFRAMMLPLIQKSASRKELELLADFRAHLEKSKFAEVYGVPADLTRLGLAARFLADMRYWRMIFRLTKPSLFLVVCSYGQEAPVAAARSCGIPTWELQHGMISEYHFGYNYGGNAIPHARALPLPERIITFGSYFSDALVSYGYRTREQVPSLGFPRLSYFKRQVAAGAGRDASSRFNILVSTQWTLEDEYYDFARQAVRLLPDNVKLVINPHPRSLARSITRLESLSGGRIEVMDKSCSMYERLGEIDLHCSVYSTTLFESAGLGIPTAVLGMPGWQNAKALLDREAAEFARDPAALTGLVTRALDDPGFLDTWRKRTEKEGEYFFEPFDLEKARALFALPPGPCR